MTEQVPGWAYSRPSAAYAVVRGEDPEVFIAERQDVLDRVLALHLVASTPPERLGSFLGAIRTALLEEQWGEAVLQWMDATGKIVDVYPDEKVWGERDLDEERTQLELRVSPVFRGFDPTDDP